MLTRNPAGKLNRWYLPAGALAVVIVIVAIVLLTPIRGVVGLASGTPPCTEFIAGNAASGEITKENLFDCYFVTAKQGENISVEIGTPDGNLDADIFTPKKQVNEDASNAGFAWLTGPKGSSAKKDITLPTFDVNLPVDQTSRFVVKVWSYQHKERGNYTLNVTIPKAGEQAAKALKPASDWEKCIPADTTGSVTGSISSSDPYDCFNITLASDQIFTVTLTSDNVTPQSPKGISLDVDILEPTGSVTGEPNNVGSQYMFTSSKQDKTFKAKNGAGIYKVKAWSYGNKNQGKYELAINVEEPASSTATKQISQGKKECKPILSGSAAEGSILAGNLYDCFTFEGSLGDEITITLESKSKTSLDVDLFTPGDQITDDPKNVGYIWLTSKGKETKKFKLSGSGKYSVKAWSYDNMTIGPYRLTVDYSEKSQVKAPSAPTLPAETEKTGQTETAAKPPTSVGPAEVDSCGNDIPADALKIDPTGCSEPDFKNGVFGIFDVSYDADAKNFSDMSRLSSLIDGIIISGSSGTQGSLRYASLWQDKDLQIAGNDLNHCSDGYAQHQLFRTFEEIGDASKQNYPVTGLDLFRTYAPSSSLSDPCYSGMFLFNEGDRYGAVQLLSNYQSGPPMVDSKPWKGGTMGRIKVKESRDFDIGTGNITWSSSGGKQGYFYSGPGLSIANVDEDSKISCGGDGPGTNSYTGASSLSELADVSSYTFTSATVGFCSLDYEGKGSNDGLLVFRQGESYGVLQFTSISGYDMVIDWWVGKKGVTDFSGAPTSLYIPVGSTVPSEFTNPKPFVWGATRSSKASFKFWLGKPGVKSFLDAETWPVYESNKWPLSMADRRPDPDRKPIRYEGEDWTDDFTYYCPWYVPDCDDGIGVFKIDDKPAVKRAMDSYGSDRTASSVLKELTDSGVIMENDYYGGLDFVYRRKPVALGNVEPVLLVAHWSDSLQEDDTGERLSKAISPELTEEFFRQSSYGKFSFNLKPENIYWFDIGENEKGDTGKCSQIENIPGRPLSSWNIYRINLKDGKPVKENVTREDLAGLIKEGRPFAVFEYAKDCATAESSGGNYGSLVDNRWSLISEDGQLVIGDLWWTHNRSGEGIKRTDADPFTQDQHTWLHEWIHSWNIDYHENAVLCDKEDVLLSQCDSREYGSQFSVMGNGRASKTPGSPVRYALGWLDGSEILQIDKSGTYTIRPINSSDGHRAAVINGGKLVAGGDTIWLEYRRPAGADAGLVETRYLSNTQGLMIHAGGLADARPEYEEADRYSNDLDEVTLNSGSWKDVNTGVKISNVTPDGDINIKFDVEFESPSECIRGNPWLTDGLYSFFHHFVYYGGYASGDTNSATQDRQPYYRTNPALPDTGQCGPNWIIAEVSEKTDPDGKRTVIDSSAVCKSYKKADGSWRVINNKLLIAESNGGWCHSSPSRYSVKGGSGLPRNGQDLGDDWWFTTSPTKVGGDLQFFFTIPSGAAKGLHMMKLRFVNIVSNQYEEYLLPVFVEEEIIGPSNWEDHSIERNHWQPGHLNAIPFPKEPAGELEVASGGMIAGNFDDYSLEEGERVFYYLDGADRESFTVSKAGEISFKSVTSFANPADFDKNNVYEVDVTRTIIPVKDQWKIESVAKSFKITIINQ